MKEKSAKQFYEEIKGEGHLYKLVNGLFIIKYIEGDICYYIGDFLKKESALNPNKTNRIKISPNQSLRYNTRDKLATTSLGFWKKLNIKFIEKPIKEILK